MNQKELMQKNGLISYYVSWGAFCAYTSMYPFMQALGLSVGTGILWFLMTMLLDNLWFWGASLGKKK